jgi:hypothetical protein
MAYQRLPGGSAILGMPAASIVTATAVIASGQIDATGEMFACVGQVWYKDRATAASKNLTRFGFRFGSVTKAGGSGLTVSAQNLNAGASQPGQPDETQDQTVAIANGNSSFASNTWIRTDALSAARSVAYGDPLAMNIEFDGSGRLGADAVQFTGLQAGSSMNIPGAVVKSSGTWTNLLYLPNLVLEFDDGTFGTLNGSLPFSAVGTHSTFNTGSTPDEIAIGVKLPFPAKVDGIWAITGGTSTADFDVVLYDSDGSSVLASESIDASMLQTNSRKYIHIPLAETAIAKDTLFYAAIKPTTANNVSLDYLDVSAAGHLQCHFGGEDWCQYSRSDAGAWSATTTRRPWIGISVSSFDDGTAVGGGALGNLFGGGLIV